MAPDDAKPLSAATPGDAVGASAPPPLDSRYTQSSGRVFMTGTQALVRMLLDQARLDAAAASPGVAAERGFASSGAINCHSVPGRPSGPSPSLCGNQPCPARGQRAVCGSQLVAPFASALADWIDWKIPCSGLDFWLARSAGIHSQKTGKSDLRGTIGSANVRPCISGRCQGLVPRPPDHCDGGCSSVG